MNPNLVRGALHRAVVQAWRTHAPHICMLSLVYPYICPKKTAINARCVSRRHLPPDDAATLTDFNEKEILLSIGRTRPTLVLFSSLS